jgi:two-component system nitrogen regulation sensor histidine kinase NtrY
MPSVEKTLNNLTEMAREILVFYEESHGYIDFSLISDATIPPFNFDLKQMKRVLINFIENAIAVLSEGGFIEISLSFDEKKQTVYMEVRDNGPGIQDEVKLRMFEPYFSTKKSGTGLGLAIASTIISEHNGTIKVIDNTPQGAIFIVELPFST